jgi:hypothetical protein
MSMGEAGKRIVFLAVLTGALLVTAASAESKARIVRLSDVQGTVQMDRGDGDGFAKAFLNMPVVEGAKLRTAADGRAEVEFEDGSVLHIVPNSEVDFTQLALSDDGQKLTTVELAQGKVYANVRSKKGGRFTLNFAHQSVALTEPAHFRVDLNSSAATLAVFQGEVQASGPAGQVEIGKKHSATFDLANKDSYTLAKNFEEEPYDAWDRQQSEYHDRYASSGNRGIQSPYAYGMSDLNYYGSYRNCPGYGLGWQPYFIGANWSPFQDGGWVWYPGYGYTWVSAYPWGWMPYRYGSWGFAQGCGWMWQPGYWNTWNVVPHVVNPPHRTPVPVPPVRGHGTVLVGQGLRGNPPAGPPRRITITPDSAGLGVPRGSVRHLDRFAKETNRNSRPVVVTTGSPAAVATPGSGSAPTTSSGGSRPSVRPSPPPRESPSPRMAPMPSAPAPMPAPRSSKPN